jgi:peptidoglycan/xylan/chitin deacetylase (PgdA/CDA1 family)
LRRKGVPASFFITSSLLDNAAVYFQDHLGLIGQAIETAGPTARAEAESCLQRVGMSWADLCACRQPQHPLIGQMSALLEVDSKAWLESEQPYVTTAQCRELLQAGFALGAHSIDHPLYAALSAEEQVRQTVVSMDSIANRFGLNYRAFAFPYGEFGVDRNFVPAMVKRGVAEVFFGTRGVVPDSRAPRMVQRLWCEDHDGSLDQHVTHALAESWVQGIGKKLKR